LGVTCAAAARHRRVLDVCRVRVQLERPAIGVHHCMAFATLDFLPTIVAARAATFGGLDALAVDDRRRRAELAKVPSAKPMESQRRVASRPASSRSRMTR